MKSANPCLSPADIEAILKNTAKNIDNLNPTYVGLLGAGRVDAAAALRATQITAAPDAKFDLDTADICEGIIRCLYTPSLPNCADSISWSVNGKTSQSFAPTFQFDSAGTYTINLFVKNSMGSNQTSETIAVASPIIIHAGGNANNQIFVCFGQEKQVPATSNTPAATYRWSPTFGLDNPNSLNPVLRVNSTATYTLTATDPAGCVVTKVLNVVLAVAPNVNAGQDESIQYLDSVQLNATATGNGLTYLWSPGTGLSDSTIANPFAKPAVTTSYTLTITDNNSCMDDDKLTVNVSGVGIEEMLAAGIRLIAPAPNPASENMILGIDLEKNAFVSLTVYDLQGKKLMNLYNEKSAPGSLRISWEKKTLHAGMYLMVWQIDGQQAVQKVIWN
jgi:PKD repeat protein